MRTALTILGIAGGVVLLVLVGVALAVWSVDPNRFVGPIQARVKAATGRDVAIGGGIELKLGLTPRLVLNDVRIANAPWAKAPDMLTAKTVEAQVALFPLLQRRFELVRLNLVDPVIALETNAEGQGNWEFAPPKTAAGAPADSTAPGVLGIGDLAITRGALTYRDGVTGRETQVVIDELSLNARDAQSPVNAEFRGRIDGIAVALTGNLGPLATLAQRHLPYPVAVQGEVAGRKTSVAVKVQRSDGLVVLQDLEATSGASKVKGKVEIRETGPRTTYTVSLTSPSLATDDIPVPVAAAPPAQRAAVAASGSAAHALFADTPLHFDALRGYDADGEVTVGRLLLPEGRAFDNVHVRFTLHGGKLDVPVVKATGFGGTVSGRLAIDASRGPNPAIALVLDGRQLDLAPLLATVGVAREVRGGKTDIAIDVATHGNSPHKWMSGINGRAHAVVGSATIVNSKLDPELIFDRVMLSVNPFRNTEPATELRCAVIRLPLANGVADVDRSIGVETKQIDLAVSGKLDFRDETLDLSFRPRVRQGIPIEIPQLAELVRLRGPFAKPTMGVDAVASATVLARIGAAVSTGGLSLLGESLVAGAGPGACEVALGKPSASARGTAKSAPAPNPAGDLGSAVGRLFGK